MSFQTLLTDLIQRSAKIGLLTPPADAPHKARKNPAAATPEGRKLLAQARDLLALADRQLAAAGLTPSLTPSSAPKSAPKFSPSTSSSPSDSLITHNSDFRLQVSPPVPFACERKLPPTQKSKLQTLLASYPLLHRLASL